MRQRRQLLQVSTFPFLAVLLCAMGSLILLLLVIDRRARVVARAKALQKSAQETAAAARSVEAEQAEWEQRRQQLRAQLQSEEAKVQTQAKAVNDKLSQTVGAIRQEEEREHMLEQQLSATRSNLKKMEQQLVFRKERATDSVERVHLSQAEMARLSTDLVKLEHTLRDLKAAREEQQRMHSLVPYKGKRGDNRQPLYVECTQQEIIIHPDRQVLPVRGAPAAAIRSVLEKRIAQRPEARDTAPAVSKDKPYLLMLVRPDGITTYYRALAAMHGLDVDFGYEFVEKDWILDFSGDENRARAQPLTIAGKPRDLPKAPAAPTLQAYATAAKKRQYQGVSFNGAFAQTPAGQPTGSGSVGPGSGSGAGGNAAATKSSASGSARLGTPVKLPDIGPAAGASSAGSGSRFGQGGIPSGPVASMNPGERPFSPGSRSFQKTPDRSLSEGQIGSAGPGQPGQQGRSVGGPVGRGGPGTNLGPTKANPRIAPSSEASPASQAARSDQADSSLDLRPTVLPEGNPVKNRDDTMGNSSAPQPAAGSPAGQPAGNPAQESPGGGMPRTGSDPLARLEDVDKKRQDRLAKPRSLYLSGNRDWIINIECTSDALVLYPATQHFALAELAQGNAGKNAILDAVQSMITRRQATVRPGEMPFRPMIRFRVRPDGLRAYYVGYPALEALHVPMARESVDPEEEAKRASGRN
jgi:hypothetical protein